MIEIIFWILPGVLFLLAGYFTVKYLTALLLEMRLYLALSFAAAIFGIWAGVVLLSHPCIGLQILVWLGCFASGYLAATAILLGQHDSRPLPELNRAEGDPGNGHTAILYFTHGEPETYDPIGWINQFREFDAQKVSFIPFFARPFFIFQLRNHYLKVGTSRHRKMHQQMVKALEQEFRKNGDNQTHFYLCFLDDAPRPDAAAIQALNDGASRIIVSEVFLTISNHTAEGEELVRQVHPERYNVPFEFTGPLWDSPALKEMFIQRAIENSGPIDRSLVGVLLVGHGQPNEWDAAWPTETQQELEFRQQVLLQMQGHGFQKENLGLAWMEFKRPGIKEMVEHLTQNGVEKILYFAAAISAESIHSQYDIPANIEKAGRGKNVALVNLGAWNDHPLVIKAIYEKILQIY